MIRTRNAAPWRLACLLVALALGSGGCAKRVPDAGLQNVTFWTTEVEQDRMAIQRELAAEFEERNPSISVKVIPVLEQDLDRKLTAAAAGGTLPDVVRVGLE